MVALKSAVRMPAWFITHGGGPLPLLGDRRHTELVQHWKKLATSLSTKPEAILLISGHWEESHPTVNVAAHPGMLYDYRGFPKEAYSIKYNAPGSPATAEKVLKLLKAAGWQAEQEAARGFDHGVFVPLKMIFPAADIPVVCLSLLSSMDAKKHIELGEAIAPLRDEGVLVIGSGSSYHNFAGLNWDGGSASKESKIFDDWLQDSLAGDHTPAERKRLLSDWANAPFGRNAHPREEHLLPAHVALGAAQNGQAKVVYAGNFLGTAVSSFEWL